MLFKRLIQSFLLLAMALSMLAAAGTAEAHSCGMSYTVQPGDWLYAIAKACGTTLGAILRANPGIGFTIYPGQVLILPGAYWDNGNGYATYVVARGDTLRALAARFGTSVEVLASLNAIVNVDRIYEGQRLTVPSSVVVPTPPPTTPPPAAGGTYTVQAGDTLRKIAARFNVTVSDILTVNPQISNANLIYVGQVISMPASPSYYTVQSGDTLKKIAARYGATLEALIALNPGIKDINLIYVGQVVRIR